MIFYMNGIRWAVRFVNPTSSRLIDRTNTLTLATTDPSTSCIYISKGISGELLKHVIRHELAHCVMLSYDLLTDIHKMVKKQYWVYAEEWMCNFIADHNEEITKLENDISQLFQTP